MKYKTGKEEEGFLRENWFKIIILAMVSLLFLSFATPSNASNLKKYYVIKDLYSDYKIIVEDSYGDQYLVEYGIGCLSMWRYEGKYIYIDVGGAFLDGIGDTIYLFDSDDDCRVWDVDELSSGIGGGYYTPPTNLSKICPTNSSLVGTSCVCNSGYVIDSTKTYCVVKKPSCPANSFNYEGQCKCNFGYIMQNGLCINHTTLCQNQFGEDSYGDGTNCYCNIEAQWNQTKTACVKIRTTTPLTSTNTAPQEAIKENKNQNTEQIREVEKNKNIENKQKIEIDSNNSKQQEIENKIEKSLIENSSHEPYISWKKIFNLIKSFFSNIFQN